MTDSKVEIRWITQADGEQVLRLYREAGWWDPEEAQDIAAAATAAATIVSHSWAFAGAFSGPRMVGMARAISDGVSDAYIQDVAVSPEFQGQGIGRRLVEAVVERLRVAHIGWIGLVAQPGTEAFYRPLGFRPLESHVAMRLQVP